MATQEVTKSAPSDDGSKEKFAYSASSFRIKTSEGRCRGGRTDCIGVLCLNTCHYSL